MTAKQAIQPEAGLVGSIQSEVATEASPLMAFLLTHARKIALALVVFIVAIAGYWVYEWQQGKTRVEDAKALGQIMVISDPAMRLEKLEGFIANAPASVRRAAWFGVMEASLALGDNEKLYNAWREIRGIDSSLKVTATLGMANAKAAQANYAEALTLLDGIAPGLSGADLINVNTRIVLLSELTGDYSRAIRACDAIIGAPEIGEEVKFWVQKKAALQQASPAGN